MSASFKLHILAADRALYEGDCVSLTLPTGDGRLGLLANHAPLVAAIVPGRLSCRLPDGGALDAVVGAGLVRFEKNDALLLLDGAALPEELDAAAERDNLARAREALLQAPAGVRREQAREELSWAEARLRAAEKQRD